MSKLGQLQGSDEILIRAPKDHVWQLIDNSQRLEDWGPPVRHIRDVDTPERIGSQRTVVAEFSKSGKALTAEQGSKTKRKKVAHFREERVEHNDGVSVGFHIFEDDIGISKLLDKVGYNIELVELGPNETKVIWGFFHDPKGLLGRIMNRPIILPQQRKNRLGALKALKAYAEQTVS